GTAARGREREAVRVRALQDQLGEGEDVGRPGEQLVADRAARRRLPDRLDGRHRACGGAGKDVKQDPQAILDSQWVRVADSFVSVYDRHVDVLADLLARARAEGSVFAQTRISEDLGIEFGGKRQLAIHTVVEGEVWFEREATDSARLTAGEII